MDWPNISGTEKMIELIIRSFTTSTKVTYRFADMKTITWPEFLHQQFPQYEIKYRGKVLIYEHRYPVEV